MSYSLTSTPLQALGASPGFFFANHPMPALSDGRAPRTTSNYGPRTGGMYDFHYGSDILYPRLAGEPTGLPQASSSKKWIVRTGAVPALAVADGVVTKSSWTGTGDRVQIDHGGGWKTGYMHMRGRKVQKGATIKAGTPVGIVSYNPWKHPKLGLNHLHLELYKDSKPIDPRSFINAAPVLPMPSTLPWLIAAGGAVVLGLYLSRYVR